MKKLFLVLLSASLFFTACKDDELSPLSVIVEGTVFDGKTNAAIEGAIVEITSKDKTYTATSNSNGYYALKTLPTGDYTVNISKGGYLSKVKELSSRNLSVNGETEVLTLNESVRLLPLTESLELTIFKVVEGVDIKEAAANVSYTVTYPEESSVVTKGTTDEYGLLKIDSLPFGVICNIDFDFVEDDIRFKNKMVYYTGKNIGSYFDIQGKKSGFFDMVWSNLFEDDLTVTKNFDVKSSIVFKFGQPVDTINSWVTFSPAYLKSWSDGNKQLTIDPVEDLDKNTQYNISIYFYSEDRIRQNSKYYTFATGLTQ